MTREYQVHTIVSIHRHLVASQSTHQHLSAVSDETGWMFELIRICKHFIQMRIEEERWGDSNNIPQADPLADKSKELSRNIAACKVFP